MPRKLAGLALFFGPLIVLMLVGEALPLEAWLPSIRSWVERSGPWSPLAFTALYVIVTNLGVPGMPLTLAAGALFDTTTGLVVATVASTLSACTMFLIARRLGWKVFGSHARKGPLPERLERQLERRGPWIVGLSRLLPMPFLLVNYSFGLSGVSFRTYALWSFVGMIPMNVLFILGGKAFAAWVAGGTVPEPLLAALVILTALAVVLALLGRRYL